MNLLFNNYIKNSEGVQGDSKAFAFWAKKAHPLNYELLGSTYGDMLILLVGPVEMSASADKLYLY